MQCAQLGPLSTCDAPRVHPPSSPPASLPLGLHPRGRVGLDGRLELHHLFVDKHMLSVSKSIQESIPYPPTSLLSVKQLFYLCKGKDKFKEVTKTL